MSEITAKEISKITTLNYAQALTFVKFGRFETYRMIGNNHIIDYDEFIKRAQEEGIDIDLSKKSA